MHQGGRFHVVRRDVRGGAGAAALPVPPRGVVRPVPSCKLNSGNVVESLEALHRGDPAADLDGLAFRDAKSTGELPRGRESRAVDHSDCFGPEPAITCPLGCSSSPSNKGEVYRSRAGAAWLRSDLMQRMSLILTEAPRFSPPCGGQTSLGSTSRRRDGRDCQRDSMAVASGRSPIPRSPRACRPLTRGGIGCRPATR